MTSSDHESEYTDLSQLICPAFYSVHTQIADGLKNEVWLSGGRGSTKSSFTAIQIILGIIQDPEANAMCLRKVGDTIKNSLQTNLLWAIDILGATESFKSTKSPAELTYIPTGQKIILKGLDDPLKLKSVKCRQGYFKYLWFEEASEFNGMEEIRNVEQSVMRGGESFVEFITYNPPNDPHAWVNEEAEYSHPDRIVHKSTYLDVPREWLGEKFFERAERLKQQDLLKYEHEYMGRAVGRAEQIVFYGKWEEKEFETPHANELYQSRYFYGADWGFANDPTHVVRCFIKEENGKFNLYIDYESRGKGVEFEDLPRLFDKVPDVRRWKIYGDCARPETISYVSRKGFNIDSAPKWSGSVEDGIEYLKGFSKIYIHPRCPFMIEEFKNYSYKVDRNTQDILPTLKDEYDHGIDALRYALADYIKSNVSIFDVL